MSKAWTERPRSISHYVAPDLRAASTGADYIVVAHHDYLAGAQQLADYRARDGMRTVVVDVDDLYNQFNDGVYNPIAIKRFLAYAYATWPAPAPQYAVLIGDGHWNFKNFSPDRYPGAAISMPPMLAWVDPHQGEVDSTNLLATIVGDDPIPDLAIGRLVVHSAAELDTIIGKIKRYEANPEQAWQKRLLFVADNTPDGAGDFVAHHRKCDRYVGSGGILSRSSVSKRQMRSTDDPGNCLPDRHSRSGRDVEHNQHIDPELYRSRLDQSLGARADLDDCRCSQTP